MRFACFLMGSLNVFHRESPQMKNVILKSALRAGRLNFIHINPGSLKPHIDELRLLLAGVCVDIVAVSETWFNDRMNDSSLSLVAFSS
jgi:hypothetical protein